MQGARRQMKEIDPLSFLKAVYMDANLPLSVRMRAAIEVLPFTHPKRAVTAVVSEGNFADLLDRRIAKLQQMEQQKLIEAKPVKENGGNADARLPPSIPDRRYRRI
jgi:hypothetical protein